MGAVSVLSYVIFMIWAFFSAPSGTKAVPAFGDPMKQTSILMSGYSVHSFLAQNIIKNPDRKSYPKIVMYSFIVGALVYTYVSYGSFCTFELI